MSTVVITSEAQYFLACFGSTERFVQKAMGSDDVEFFVGNETKMSLPLKKTLAAFSCFAVKARPPITFAAVEKSIQASTATAAISRLIITL